MCALNVKKYGISIKEKNISLCCYKMLNICSTEFQYYKRKENTYFQHKNSYTMYKIFPKLTFISYAVFWFWWSKKKW